MRSVLSHEGRKGARMPQARKEHVEPLEAGEEEVVGEIFTVANLISFIRLCMAPVFLALLFEGNDIAAAALFAIASVTDFLDGQIARRTHTVSRLGQLMDPVIDRVLMITAVLGLLIVGRLPLWIVVVVLVRDVGLLAGGFYLLKRHHVRVPVVYAGKFATTFLFVGCAGLLLNAPLIAGLGVTDISWLPGFNGETCSWGIWSVYAGLILAALTTVYYVVRAALGLAQAGRKAA